MNGRMQLWISGVKVWWKWVNYEKQRVLWLSSGLIGKDLSNALADFLKMTRIDGHIFWKSCVRN